MGALPPQIKKITLKNGKVRYHVKEAVEVPISASRRDGKELS
jgi:hypothetical protein